jgi:uracil-DNA glycosylase
LPPDWQKALAAEFEKPYFAKLEQFVAEERTNQQVFPPEADMFNAFKHTPFKAVKVLLLGQDPYHDDGQAHGLCFSVKPGVKPPPSLVNIFKELESDVGATPPGHGHLTAWADRGVMLLNAVLTVRAHEPASHKDHGWETFTDAVIKALNDRPDPVVFLLWGAYAQKKQDLIDAKKHRVLTAAHPSPLSAKKFFGSKPFSQANKALKELGKEPIDWQLPPVGAADAPPAPSVKQVTAAEPTAESSGGGLVEQVLGVGTRLAEQVRSVGEKAPAAEADPPFLVSGLLSSVLAPKPAPSVTGLAAGLHAGWQAALADEFRKPYFAQLEQFLEKERAAQTVLPEAGEVFAALNLAPYEQVRAVFLGDAPSEVEGESDGLAFSRRPGVRLTDELENMFQELKHDRGCWLPSSGGLAPWARQGVLLLNRVLTVRTDAAGSHQKKGWETFTEAVLRALNARARPVVFVFWHGVDRKTRSLVDADRHVVLEAPNPADAEFVGSGLFTTVNNELELRGQSAVYWQLFAM